MMVMATLTSKATHGALAALLMGVVAVAFLAGACRAQVVEAPPVGVFQFNVTNHLDKKINFTLTSTVAGDVARFYISVEINPNESKGVPLNVLSAASGDAQALITDAKLVYEIPVGYVQRVLGQITGSKWLTLSSPCPDHQLGFYVVATSAVTIPGIMTGGNVCTGPPISSN